MDNSFKVKVFWVGNLVLFFLMAQVSVVSVTSLNDFDMIYSAIPHTKPLYIRMLYTIKVT